MTGYKIQTDTISSTGDHSLMRAVLVDIAYPRPLRAAGTHASGGRLNQKMHKMLKRIDLFRYYLTKKLERGKFMDRFNINRINFHQNSNKECGKG